MTNDDMPISIEEAFARSGSNADYDQGDPLIKIARIYIVLKMLSAFMREPDFNIKKLLISKMEEGLHTQYLSSYQPKLGYLPDWIQIREDLKKGLSSLHDASND